MYLQHRIKISKEDASKLVQILDKRDLLWDIQNSNFLCRDLETLEKNYSNQKNEFGRRIGPIVKELGNFVSPDYGIKLKCLYEEYGRYLRAGETQNLQFLCGPSANGLAVVPGVSIYVMDGENHKIQFWEGGLCLQNTKPGEFITGKILFELASFFYNRRDLYSKIKEVLSKNYEEFETITTPEFAKDLVALFSAKDDLNRINDFNIDFNEIEEKKVSGKFIRNNRIWVERMSCYVKSSNKAIGDFSRLQTEVWLDQKNTLIFNTYEEDCISPKKNLENYTGTRAYIEARAGDMLNQLASSTSFHAAIYEKVKAKILLDGL